MDQRNQPRVVADRELCCLWRGAELRMFVYNLFVDGCVGFLRECDAEEGDVLSIGFLSDGHTEGRIVWRHGSVLGIAFVQKLDAATVELMNAVR